MTAIKAPGALHKNAWDRMSKGARTDPTTKYAIYASRTLAVYHPEIYLQADVETLKRMTENEKIQKWLGEVGIKKLTEFYPNNSPYFPILDQRLLPPTATLRKLQVGEDGRLSVVDQTSIPEISKAEIAYHIHKHRNNDSGTILYCDDESAFLLINDDAISMKDLKPSKVECKPTLIFNELYVWYPLMGRDDTSRSQELRRHVERFAPHPKYPQMTPWEQETVKNLKETTKIKTACEMKTIRVVTQNTTPLTEIGDGEIHIGNPKNYSDWRDSFQDFNLANELTIQRVHLGFSSLLLQDIHIRSNQLSPISALFASHILDSPEESRPKLLSDLYHRNFRWGEVWTWGLTDFTIDESLFSGGGGVCVTHADNIVSILNVANIDNIALHTYQPTKDKDHRVVYVPQWKATFSNGTLSNQSGKTIFDPVDFSAIVYLRQGTKWAFFANPIHIGNMGTAQIKRTIAQLHGEFGDSINGIQIQKTNDEIKNSMVSIVK